MELLEHAPLILQIISAIVAPILAGITAWITNSLKKTNQRIDALEARFNDNRVNDVQKLGELNSNLRALNASNEAFLREMDTIRDQLNRIDNFLHRVGK